MPVFASYKPMLVYVTKNPAVVKASYERAGWNYDPADEARCRRFFEAWPHAKLQTTAERVAAAVGLFDLARVAGSAKPGDSSDSV